MKAIKTILALALFATAVVVSSCGDDKDEPGKVKGNLWTYKFEGKKTEYKIASAGVGVFKSGSDYILGYNFVFSDVEQIFPRRTNALEGNWIYIDIAPEKNGQHLTDSDDVDADWIFVLRMKGEGKVYSENIKSVDLYYSLDGNQCTFKLTLKTKDDEDYTLNFEGELQVVDNRITDGL